MNHVSRRAFMVATPLVALPSLLECERRAVASMLQRMEGGPALGADYPTQDPTDVKAIVGAAHVKLDEVAAMVTQRPSLARAAWDWGFGDWETALGAASHMGRRDIAEVLLAHGARPNLFTFAMLGQVDVVRAVCKANPGIQRTPGPHGITLLKHALAGKEQAQSVVDYLTQLGGADESPMNLPLSETTANVYLGKYQPVGMTDVTFVVGWSERQPGLNFKREGSAARPLLNAGKHIFYPAGAPNVRLMFEVIDDRAAALLIEDGDASLTIRRSS